MKKYIISTLLLGISFVLAYAQSTGDNLPSGCKSTSGYSILTGTPCNGSVAVNPYANVKSTSNNVVIPIKASTCTSINSNISYYKRKVNSEADVYTLQNFLKAKGYLKYEPNGYFGPATQAATIAFQKDNGLFATPVGYIGAGTRALIKGMCDSGTGVNGSDTGLKAVIINSSIKSDSKQPVSENVGGVLKPVSSGIFDVTR